MDEMEGTYRVLQTPGARLGTQTNTAISTLEPGQSLSLASSQKARGKGIQLTVLLLDDVREQVEVEQKAYGQGLIDEICHRLNLVESDYFGLEFRNNRGNEIWLEPAKLIVKQVRRPKNTVFRLSVKFFPPDPGQLQEEYTRYLFALQIKRDLTENKIMCSENTSALLVSHLLQSEIGDYDETQDLEYLKSNTLLPNQKILQEKIMEFHRQNIGQTPAESDFQVLEIARKLEMFGIRFHPASDREGTKINLAVAHMGVLVFQGNTKINTFNWAKIRKLSFKRKRFLIKLHPEVHDSYQDTLEFLLADRDLCKIFWKNCVEYHSFFRLMDQPKPKTKPVLFSRGSSFRYSGRTQKQLVDYMRESMIKTTPYQRRHSRARISARTSSADVPKQSLSFTEGVEVPGSPSSDAISFQSIQSVQKTLVDSQLIHPENSNVLLVSKHSARRAPSDVKRSPTLEDSWKTSDRPSPISLQGSVAEAAGSCSRSSSGCDERSALTRQDSVSDRRFPPRNDNDEDDYTTGIPITENEYNVSQIRGRAMPIFTLTNAQLQLSEEFIDDDPAEISFFAGGSEAFSPCYHGLGNGTRGSAIYCQQDRSPVINSCEQNPVKCINNNMELGSEVDLEFEGGSDLNGNSRPIDTADLFEVKAQASRLYGHYSKSETSSLLNHQSESSSLTNLGLNGLSETALFRMGHSGNQSEASSMVNFPTYSVRSESSSAFQFGDMIDQLEQLSYPPTTTEDSTSSESGSWDSDNGVPLDGSLIDSLQLSPLTTRSPLNVLLPGSQVSNLDLPSQSQSPLQSPILSDAGSTRVDDEDDDRRKRCPADKAYFIAKEILTTERTYLKDLEVITVWFRSAVIKESAMPEGLMTLLFSNIDPIYEFHRGFLKEVEQRLALWEGRSNAHVKGDYQRIGDVMLRNMCTLKEFTSYLQKYDEVLLELERATKQSKKLEGVYKEFELQKVCYLPLNTFLLKPIQRLMHYKLILERLCKQYRPDHRDYSDCRNALKEVRDMSAQLHSSLIRLEHFQKLTELQRDLIGIENLILPGRDFIREGCLYKLTKKGLQQRMFFLFSDMLLYTSKGVTASNQFKVHGQLPLCGMILIVLEPPVEETENEWSVPHCFTIYSAPKTVVVAASSRVEMGKWIEDLTMAIEVVKKSNEKRDTTLESNISDCSNRSSDEVSLEQESEDDTHSSHSSLEKQIHHRANTTMHVCWHRNTSVSMLDHSVAVELPLHYLLGQGQRPNTITHVCWYRNQSLSLTDYLRMFENQLSGYLLRKFKNSSGWQKLWVVFTNFCLFFYKTHQDDYPLASLPLLGYVASIPTDNDRIHKDYVFKLQFKSHVYFFRAESEYTFERWIEVIKSATSSPGRMVHLSQKDGWLD